MPVLRTAGSALWFYARNWDRAEADFAKPLPSISHQRFRRTRPRAHRGNCSEVAEQERALDLLGALPVQWLRLAVWPVRACA
jgi:hypothetical protein